jgi:hypothetical protein
LQLSLLLLSRRSVFFKIILPEFAYRQHVVVLASIPTTRPLLATASHNRPGSIQSNVMAAVIFMETFAILPALFVAGLFIGNVYILFLH